MAQLFPGILPTKREPFAHAFGKNSNFSSRRRDSFGPKSVQIRAILTIFRLFEDFQFYFWVGEKYLDVLLLVFTNWSLKSTEWKEESGN